MKGPGLHDRERKLSDGQLKGNREKGGELKDKPRGRVVVQFPSKNERKGRRTPIRMNAGHEWTKKRGMHKESNATPSFE